MLFQTGSSRRILIALYQQSDYVCVSSPEFQAYLIYSIVCVCSCSNLLCPLGSKPGRIIHEVRRLIRDIFQPGWDDICWTCSCPPAAQTAGESVQFNVLLLRHLCGFYRQSESYQSSLYIVSLLVFIWTIQWQRCLELVVMP